MDWSWLKIIKIWRLIIEYLLERFHQHLPKVYGGSFLVVSKSWKLNLQPERKNTYEI